ncbi:DUF1254 domain-containing protein [Tsukamurella sputi]
MFARLSSRQGIGAIEHSRSLTSIDKQDVIRMNRDTLYSNAVVDLDAGPATVRLPDPGGRFMSMAVIDEDHYIPIPLAYGAGEYTISRDRVSTRYAAIIVRIFVDPNSPDDQKAANQLQDRISLEQKSRGVFEAPQWDKASQDRVRTALLGLAATITDTRKMFGPRNEVDELDHLLGVAAGWGGNPAKDATYFRVAVPDDSGRTAYRMRLAKEVPADAFWSVSVYNAQGYFDKNPRDAYTINNVTAARNPDGSVDVQYGACENGAPNCLPIGPGWNVTLRLYRPRESALDGAWRPPSLEPLG